MERERRLDPQRFAREYEAEFFDDISTFIPAAWVDDAIVRNRHERHAIPGVEYIATTDPTGGGSDHWPLHIAHVEQRGDTPYLVQDVLRSHRRVGSESPDLDGIVNCLCRGHG